ncbi:hypothetical protein C8J57DRAFT_1520047 [Mycena rebaudengoi]|nr:hypothetical protein C8J57DRAFT_1520047 [Mycena rebaudengoi]
MSKTPKSQYTTADDEDYASKTGPRNNPICANFSTHTPVPRLAIDKHLSSLEIYESTSQPSTDIRPHRTARRALNRQGLLLHPSWFTAAARA